MSPTCGRRRCDRVCYGEVCVVYRCIWSETRLEHFLAIGYSKLYAPMKELTHSWFVAIIGPQQWPEKYVTIAMVWSAIRIGMGTGQ